MVRIKYSSFIPAEVFVQRLDKCAGGIFSLAQTKKLTGMFQLSISVQYVMGKLKTQPLVRAYPL